eukprot:CAMPEP_0197521010 /NCGR_PEP_ID=MMETSP1318-20131121/6321_1 /TAXON_ID=552666 /ORGANISM="Partenskyella glossopodia, Strain RCC365" /LENGTH=203 /DNA_ID=CAMNT_0043072813 /DNA_START=346 /DNA_END=958 /DNA_ORIENTATION=+
MAGRRGLQVADSQETQPSQTPSGVDGIQPWIHFSVPDAAAAADRAAADFGNKSTTINMFDLLLAVMFVVLLCLEYQADQQQYDFQTEKYRQIGRKINRKGEYLVGFVRTGLWSISRHPNYFCEQSLWLVYYLFSVTAGNDLVNWSGIGIFLLILLFKGSAAFSEGITAAKYPEYGVYQATVPLFIPYKLSLYRAFVNQGVKSE